MKKLSAIVLCFALFFCLSACNKQPHIDTTKTPSTTTTSISDTTSSSASDTITTSGNATSNPSSAPKPPATTTTSYAQYVPPRYSGTYAEDTKIGDLIWSYTSLKGELQNKISTASPTLTTAASKKYSFDSDFDFLNVFGYPLKTSEKATCTVTTDNSGNITEFFCEVTAAYRDKEFAKQAVRRDLAKMTQFSEQAEIAYFIAFDFGNPDDYKSFEAIPERELERIYMALSPDAFVNIQFLNEDKSIKCMFTFGAKTDEDGIKKFTSRVTVYY